MLRINLHLCLLLTLDYFHNGATVNYNPYHNNIQQHHLLHATNTANDGYSNAQQSTAFNADSVYQPNPQGNSNYQQLYRYYYAPPYQQRHQPFQSQQSKQIWSGPPIVVEDDIQHVEQQQQQQQHKQSSANIPPIFYQQHSTGSTNTGSSRHSKVLTPTVYNPLPTTHTSQAYFTNNNNNNNIIYHRDFRHEIYAVPDSAPTRPKDDTTLSWNNRQQQKQLVLPQQQQLPPQKFYSSNRNLSYNPVYNDLLASSWRKVDVPDYREHFKRYLENNPHRIKPIY